jgi:hypothetical protein
LINSLVNGFQKNSTKVGIFIAYICVIAYQIYNHQMWRDELQAWMLSKESRTLQDFIEYTRYEGRSPLYHVLISPISHTTDNPEWLKLFTFILVLGVSYLIIFKLDISTLAKVLILFGFPFIAGYTTISRDYIVIIFLSLVILVRYLNHKHNFIDIFVLSVIALINAFGLIISLYWMLIKSNYLRKNFYTQVPILIVSMGFSAFFIYPERQNTFQISNRFDLQQIIEQIKNIFMEAIVFDSNLTYWLIIPILIYVSIFYFVTWKFDKKLFLGLTLSTILLIQVYLFTPGNFWWHKGMLTMVFLFTLIILSQKEYNKKASSIIAIMFYVFLTLQIYANFTKNISGVWVKNYSNAKITSQFLKQNCKSYCDYIVNQEYIATPISAFLAGKELYSFDKQRFSTFTIWDSKVSDWDWNRASELSYNLKNPLFILNQKMDAPDNFRLLIAFEGAAWKDENYFIYELVK